uniref:Galactose-3-O-sulfotransferase 3 n=1 Tax=Gopherus evgoodei TaxID=1825980 RepID=A0A8C4WN25_9SAUR
MPYALLPLQCALKMMSRKKALLLLLLLALSTLSLLIHQSVHLNWSPKPSSPGCPPAPSSHPKHTSVAFLKTHKTAGTTVQNILFRFAEQHNVTVALPHHACDHQFCYPRNFSARFVHPHLRFQHQELHRLMPNDTLYVTILREPVAMFESLFTYYNQYCSAFKRVPNGSMEAFLANPLAFYRPQDKFSMYAHNTLLYDLGGDNDHSPADLTYLSNFIRQMEEVFSLVMIAEYFDDRWCCCAPALLGPGGCALRQAQHARIPGPRATSAQRCWPPASRAWNGLDAGSMTTLMPPFWRKVAQAGRECVAEEVRALRRACTDSCCAVASGGGPSCARHADQETRSCGPGSPAPMWTSWAMTCLRPQYSRYMLRKQSQRTRRRAMLHRPLPPRGVPRPARALPLRHPTMPKAA